MSWEANLTGVIAPSCCERAAQVERPLFVGDDVSHHPALRGGNIERNCPGLALYRKHLCQQFLRRSPLAKRTKPPVVSYKKRPMTGRNNRTRREHCRRESREDSVLLSIV